MILWDRTQNFMFVQGGAPDNTPTPVNVSFID